jgi:hypothetical protein
MFKIGDKIKVISKIWWIDKYLTNKVGTVTKIDTSGGFPFTISIGEMSVPVDGNEIEKVVIKGQQLLFSFMEE